MYVKENDRPVSLSSPTGHQLLPSHKTTCQEETASQVTIKYQNTGMFLDHVKINIVK